MPNRRTNSTADGHDPDAILSVSGLVTQFETYRGVVEALDGVELDVGTNEIVGIVGESGCGKSVTARSILRLIDEPGRIVDGEIRYKGRDLLELSEKEMRKRIRGSEIAMIFQNPTNALNPVYTVGEQIAEAVRKTRDVSDGEAKRIATELMQDVGIPDPESRYSNHPHEFSGGMKQRVLIAKSLACDPDLLIADEPTTALDKTTEAQLLDLIDDIRENRGLSMLIITHDLRVISRLCDRVVVMYAGQTVEAGSTRDVIKDPVHPYTKGLIGAIPKIGAEGEDIDPIEGSVLDVIDPNAGCRFYDRCPRAVDHCLDNKPELEEKRPDQYAACFEV